jgi:2-methylfumaryl-CoA hydratase
MYDPSFPGPFYETFTVGATLPPLPSVTLTDADNMLYRAITGDQHALAADRILYQRASGRGPAASLVNPGVVLQYSIGQTTMATRQAIANLYYRDLRIHRPIEVGETLSTVTTVLGLRDSASKGDQHRGKVWLGITTRVGDEPVVTYERCALVRGTCPPPGHNDDIPGPSNPTPLDGLAALAPNWDLAGLAITNWPTGETRSDPLRDHVDMAAPLARLTFNQAAVHRDNAMAADGRRLVYGGHVQGLGQASLTRMLPGFATIVAWDGCDHTGPAHEGDLLEFRHTILEQQSCGSGRLIRFEVVGACRQADGTTTDILRWTPVVWAAGSAIS